MHLCLLGPDWRTTSILRKEFVRDARAEGWEISIVCGSDGERFIPEFEVMGVRCITVPLDRGSVNPLASLVLLFRLVGVLRNLRPDAVLAFTVVPMTLGLLASQIAGVRSRVALVTGVGYAFTFGGGLKRRILRTVLTNLLRLSFRALSLAIFQNLDDQALYRQLGVVGGGVRTAKVNGSGVDLQRFSQAPLPEAHSFVMVCRLLREKGVLEFARAAEIVRKTRPGVKFVLVAPQDVNPGALQADDLKPWTVSGTLQHVGFCEDVRPWLRSASAFVLPSYREGTPRAALEALATGRPVITTDAPGCREVVIDGVTGYLVPPRDEHALASAMLKMIENPTALGEMGQRAREDAENRFDVRKVNMSMICFIESIFEKS
jgi:glycosyltransferase involved in cell wall biosynthesis